MSQYVIEFGADRAQAIASAIGLCLPSPHHISVDTADRQMNYVKAERGLADVVADLKAGVVASAVIRCNDERMRYALIVCPRFNNSGLSKWMGTIEVCVEDWSFVWDALLVRTDLLFVCVGAEEGVELRDEQLNVELFPWTQWPLLVGALRMDSGLDWVVRRGAGQ